jgi:serine/threonine protein kinase
LWGYTLLRLAHSKKKLFLRFTSVEKVRRLGLTMNPNQNRRHKSDDTHDRKKWKPFDQENRAGRLRSTEIGRGFHKQGLHQADFYPDPTPALPIINLPQHAQELMNDNWQPKPMRYDAKLDPTVGELTTVYPTLKQAMKETDWAICRRFLGTGSFGFVYLGFRFSELDLPMDQRHLAAVKHVYNHRPDKPIVNVMKQPQPPGELPEGPFATHPAYNVCFREIELLERLKHKNIVRMLSHFAVEKTRSIYIVLEYCENRDLWGEIKLLPEYRFSIPVARYFFKQLIDGLVYMHELYVVHCDLKLDNLLVKIHPNGRDKILKIADFGNSAAYKRLNPADGVEYIIGGKGNRGTIPYQPPEVLAYYYSNRFNMLDMVQRPPRPHPASTLDQRNRLSAEPKSILNRRNIIPLPEYQGMKAFSWPPVDVYCSGVCLYILLTGTLPYDPARWPADLDYVFRCQPRSYLSLMDRQTWDFLTLLLEPITDRNSVDASAIPNVRPTAAQIRTHPWMQLEAVPNDLNIRQLDQYHQTFVPPLPTPPARTPSSPLPEQESRKRQRSPSPGAAFDPNVPSSSTAPHGPAPSSVRKR